MKFYVTILLFFLALANLSADSLVHHKTPTNEIVSTVDGNYVVFKLIPKNATLTIDGNRLDYHTNGVYTFFMHPGNHHYKVEAVNCKFEKGVVVMHSEKIIENIELKSVLADVSLQSVTPNVDIIIDGNLIDIHSWSGELMSGYHYLKVIKNGYYAYDSIFRVKENQSKEIKIPALIGKYGNLKVNTNPIDMFVYIDGAFVGNSPCVVKDLVAGEHTIEYKKDIFSKLEHFTIDEFETKKFYQDFEKKLSNSAALKAKELFVLGEKYYYGERVPLNYKKASDYFFQAGTLGYSDAQYLLAIMYMKGKGLVKSNKNALIWFKKAALQGDPNAQYKLGSMFEHGVGTKANTNNAVYWYRKAAEQGNLNAECDLASMYENGKGVNQYYHEAVKWYRIASEQGSARGQYHYGLMYQYGKGVSQNINIAVYWYRKAAKQNNIEAKNKLKELGYYVE